MVFDSEGLMSLGHALLQAEKLAGKMKQPLNLDAALSLAKTESDHPSVGEAWRSVDSKGGKDDPLFPSHNVASLVLEESMQPQAVGHALVQACRGGHILCVRRLREIQNEHLSGSMLVGLFTAFGILKAAEAGHADVVEELLKPMMSASTALMGYMVATRWNSGKGAGSYPFVEQPSNTPSSDWMRKMTNSKSMLPVGSPNFQVGGWDLRGLPGLHENLHELVRASYRTYLLWRTSVVAASQCHAEVFRVLLNRRQMDNAALAESLHSLETPRGEKRGHSGLDHEAKKIIADRAKMDTLMYQLVEEYSTKNYHDAMLYTLWGHIQRGGNDHPSGPGAGKPRCVAQAQNGIWEMQLEVPLLMMPVEHALEDEEPFKRYKQLTLLYTQKAKVNIQLIAVVESQPSYVQVTVGVKHVRFKAENSRWDEMCMGHFPTCVTLSLMPQSKEGTSVTMTNSSSNTVYKIGKAENISVGSGAGDGATRGMAAGIRASAAISVNSTMKATPWRFEQLPLGDDRGGSFKWTLQSMKGIPFERSNPHRMADTNSRWNWGRRVPGNPLDELPFTSEGGVIFTGTEFADTMMWRFPKTMEGRKLRWSIEGQIHSTFTTSRYFETRMASFCGDIEEKLKPMTEDKKDKDKDKDGEKGEKSEKKEKLEKSEKSEKGDKLEKEEESSSKPTLGKFNTTMRTEFQEWLDFKKYKEEVMRAKVEAAQAETASNEGEPKKDKEQAVDSAQEQRSSRIEMEKKTNKIDLKVADLKLKEKEASLANRPSLLRAKANNGRWLGSQEMEVPSPSHQLQVGGELRSIVEEDLYPVPEYISRSQNQRMSQNSSRSRDHQR